MSRLPVTKTYKLFIAGKFPRTESGRSMKIDDADGNVFAHLCQGSRKDLRDAVEASRSAATKWANATAYLRGQILYRMAEMLEGKRREFAEAIEATAGATAADADREVAASIDRLVAFAGWTDKYTHVLGGHNPVAGPYYDFTIPEPSGIVGVVPPDTPSLLAAVSLIAAPLCAGNVVILIANRPAAVAAALLGEVCATSDVPGGVVNVITCDRGELVEHLAQHREVIGINAANLSDDDARTLRLGAAENVKRVRVHDVPDWYDGDAMESPWMIEPFVEMKTVWHPSSVS